MTDERPPVPDPMALWREWVAQSERQWNKFFNDVMGTDQYNQAMSRFMDLYLNNQKTLGETMGRYLTGLNVATHSDVLAIGERLAAIDDRLTAIERRLGGPSGGDDASPSPVSTATAPRPPRTKKPPAPAKG